MSCELPQSVSILGSAEWCDIVLESPQVAAAHAAVVRYGGSGYLCDLGARGGASLNGQHVRWARLTTGDHVGVGPFEFTVEIAGESAAADVSTPVFGLQGDEEIGFVASIDPVLLIGSDGGCDVVLNEAGVQPVHCLMVWTDRGPIVRDLSGEKLTWVNGAAVTTALLSDGITVGVGSQEFIFEVENEPTFEQVVGGRFSEAVPSVVSHQGEVPSLIAGRFENSDGMDPAITDSEANTERPADCGALVRASRPGYFNEIISGAHEDLTDMADASRASAGIVATPEGNGAADSMMETGGKAIEGVEEKAELTVGMTPEAILRRAEQLQAKTTEMRRRVAEAQRALDSRAQKHREEILRERQRLREKRALLQMQAKALIEAAKPGTAQGSGGEMSSRSVAISAPGAEGGVLEIHDEPAQKAFVAYVANEAHVRKLVSGEADLIEVSDFNTKETDRLLNDPRSYAAEDTLKTLDERASELVRVAQAERKEIERGEALVETLRFETERQRRSMTRRQEKLRAREMSLEERFRALSKAREAIRKERAPLLARLKALDADENVIRDRLNESERIHQEIAKEGDSIDELQQSLETRERALLHKLEMERQRLLARQTELKRKAAQLAKAAREKRLSIEQDMLRQQAELEVREAELRAQRQQIEETARGEMEKTAGGLEQVLNVRLAEIESELESRRMDLDTKVQELSGLNHAQIRATRETRDPIDGPLRRIASEFAGFGRFEDEVVDADSRPVTLDHLEAEIDAFSRARASLAANQKDDGDEPLASTEDSDAPDQRGGLGLDVMQRSLRYPSGAVEEAEPSETTSASASEMEASVVLEPVKGQPRDRNEEFDPD